MLHSDIPQGMVHISILGVLPQGFSDYHTRYLLEDAEAIEWEFRYYLGVVLCIQCLGSF